jgi:hypothetical protein
LGEDISNKRHPFKSNFLLSKDIREKSKTGAKNLHWLQLFPGPLKYKG